MARQTTKLFPLDDLKPFPDNPRQGDIGAIMSSLSEHGQFRPIIVNVHEGGVYGDQTVLGGNHTLEAARQLGWMKIAGYTIDVDDDRAMRIVIADNRTSDLASWDKASLAEILTGIDAADGLTGTGYDREDLDRLVADISAPLAFTDLNPDDMETPTECPRCGYEF